MSGNRQTIAENFDTFLQLLTAQLKNQNPLEPLDSNEFTAQLVQFTSVEQALKTNEFLEAMMLSGQNANNAQAVSYIGKTVTASGATTDLTEEGAAWLYRIDEPAPNTTITVRDQAGNTVFTEKVSLEAGTGRYGWNGQSSSGETMPLGRYTVTIDARNSSGALVPATTQMMGIVEAVDVSGAEPYLTVSGLRLPLSAVTTVQSTPVSGGS